MMRAAFVNESNSRLDRVLRGYLHAEWWYAVDHDVGGDPKQWPTDAVEGLLLALTQWRSEVGRVDMVARTYACVPHEKGFACVLQISYAKVKDVSLPSTMTENPGGSDQVNAASPVRSFSASLCGDV